MIHHIVRSHSNALQVCKLTNSWTRVHKHVGQGYHQGGEVFHEELHRWVGGFGIVEEQVFVL